MKNDTNWVAAALFVAGVMAFPQPGGADITAPPYAPEMTFNISGPVIDSPEGVALKNSIKQKVDWYWTHGSCPADSSQICTPDDSCGGDQVCAAGYDDWATCPDSAGPESGATGEQGPCYCWDGGAESCEYDSQCLSGHSMCVERQCREAHFDWAQCDQLRYGLTVFDEPQCGMNVASTHRLVDEQEEGQDVEQEINGLTSGQRAYCRDKSWRPTDRALLDFQRVDKFPGGTDADEADQDRWWERPNVNLLMISELPQTSNADPGDRVSRSILNACRLLEGRHIDDANNAVPPIITYVLVGPRSTPVENRYGGLLAAAGGTGRCCWTENGKPGECTAGAASEIDVCEHIRESARSESQLRQHIQQGNYACEYRETQNAASGAMIWDQKPDLDCHLVGTNAGNPGADPCGTGNSLAAPTDVLGEMTCLQAVPRGRSFADLEYRYCPNGVDNEQCEVILREDIRFVDPNEEVFLLTDRDMCEALRTGDGRVVRDPCPNAGDVCDTGEEGRCGVGRIRCVAGREECIGQFDAMPEICNGLDDDCDGRTDNITDSWPNFQYTPADLPGGYEEIECRQNDACVCPEGRSDSHVGEDFTSYVEGWGGACYCEGF